MPQTPWQTQITVAVAPPLEKKFWIRACYATCNNKYIVFVHLLSQTS